MWLEAQMQDGSDCDDYDVWYDDPHRRNAGDDYSYGESEQEDDYTYYPYYIYEILPSPSIPSLADELARRHAMEDELRELATAMAMATTKTAYVRSRGRAYPEEAALANIEPVRCCCCVVSLVLLGVLVLVYASLRRGGSAKSTAITVCDRR